MMSRREPSGISPARAALPAPEQMQDSIRNQVAARGWFRKVPSAAAISGLGLTMIAFAVFAVLGVGFWIAWTRALPRVLLLLIPLLPIIVTVAVTRTKLKRGQRTAEGRALCDQVEGFQNYLASAEADQLKFEEGEDIFSKYLPWAIIFELADRWAKICADLVAMGRLPNETPYWYIGNYQLATFNTAFLTSSLTSAATPVASSSVAAGTGFGGGSSFPGGASPAVAAEEAAPAAGEFPKGAWSGVPEILGLASAIPRLTRTCDQLPQR
jgi:uncharacterized membrane protein